MMLMLIIEGPSPGTFLIEGVTDQLEKKMQDFSAAEGRSDWVSEEVIEYLEQYAKMVYDPQDWPSVRVLDSTGAVALEAHLECILEAMAEAERKGKLFACKMIGWPATADVNPVPFACSAVATWIQAYSGVEGAPVVVDTVKVRPRPAADQDEPICEKLQEAVESLGALHPDWTIAPTGVVRLNPRHSRPTSCAGVYIYFGHTTKAVLWPVDRGDHAKNT